MIKYMGRGKSPVIKLLPIQRAQPPDYIYRDSTLSYPKTIHTSLIVMYRILEGIDTPEADKQYKSVVYKLAQLDYPSDAVLSPSAARRCKGACSHAANLNRKRISKKMCFC